MFSLCRSIACRRFCALSGSVLLLRCATMFITSLSVPGSHLECAPRVSHWFYCYAVAQNCNFDVVCEVQPKSLGNLNDIQTEFCRDSRSLVGQAVPVLNRSANCKPVLRLHFCLVIFLAVSVIFFSNCIGGFSRAENMHPILVKLKKLQHKPFKYLRKPLVKGLWAKAKLFVVKMLQG